MPRKKSRDAPFWRTGPKCGKSASGKPLPFTQLYVDLLQSPQFSKLSSGAGLLYVCMTAEAKENRSFVFPASVAKRYGIKEPTLRRNCKDLIEGKFIRVVPQDPNDLNPCKVNRYEFSEDWKLNKT